MTKHEILAEHENDNRVHRLETTDDGYRVRHLRRQDAPNENTLVEVETWSRPINEHTAPARQLALAQAIRVFSVEAGVTMLETERAVAQYTVMLAAARILAPPEPITEQTEIEIATVGDLRRILERMTDSDPIWYLDFSCHGTKTPVTVTPHDPNDESCTGLVIQN